MAARSSAGEPSWPAFARREGRLRFRRHGGSRGNGSCRGAIVSMPRGRAGGSVQIDTRVRKRGSIANKVGGATDCSAPSGGGRLWSQPVESRSPGNGKVERRVGANRRGDGRRFGVSARPCPTGNGGRHGGRLRVMCLRQTLWPKPQASSWRQPAPNSRGRPRSGVSRRRHRGWLRHTAARTYPPRQRPRIRSAAVGGHGGQGRHR